MAAVTVERTEGDLMTLSMGPQHPSTHGVLRLVLQMDGEVVVGTRASKRWPRPRPFTRPSR
jgi:NADH-quinone oxidoreductase subunit D